jgi:hypothetical protein
MAVTKPTSSKPVAFKPQAVPDPLPQPRGSKVSFTEPVVPGSYGGSDGGGSRFKQFYRNNKWYFWAIVLGIIIIGTLAFFAFRKQKPEPTDNANVSVEITAPDTAPSGSDVIYKVQINNDDQADLVDMSLDLIYDDGISYVSSTPPAENQSGSRFKVPDLASGQNAALIIKTTAQGDINEEKKVTARLQYKFSNFNSNFVEETSHTVRLVTADVILDMTGPQSANNLQTASYDVLYRNDAGRTIDNGRVVVTYPSEFKYLDSDPKPSPGQNIWNVGSLSQNDFGKISFSGNFEAARPGQQLQFKVEFMAQDEHGSFFTQSSTTYMTTIIAQELSAEQRLTNEAPGNVVSPGSSLQYELKYQNNTDVAVNGINIVVEIDSPAVDLSTVRANAGFVENNQLTWNASSVPQLERLNPGQGGTVSFSFQLKNPAVSDNTKNVQVVTRSKIRSIEKPVFLNGNQLTFKVSSPSSIERGVSHSAGALPLKVGQNTTVSVNISLRNASNDYREGVFTGFIPLGVSFNSGSVVSSESAATKYDPATGKLTWTVGQLAAHSGSINPLRRLQFNVNLTPNSNQVNQPITLLRNINFAAKDAFTDQNISLQSQELTTDGLPGEGNGRVRP